MAAFLKNGLFSGSTATGRFVRTAPDGAWIRKTLGSRRLAN